MWADGYRDHLASYEVHLRRRKDTFGGYVWPDPPPGRIPYPRQIEIAIRAMERRERA